MIALRHGVNCLLKRRGYLHIEWDASLLATHGHHAIANVLASHADNVAPGLPGLQK
jgi:hypothetical protein